MEINVEKIKELRELCGAGVMECRAALVETGGDLGKAADILKKKSLAKAEKKVARVVRQGLVESYIHTGGKIGALVEVNCETDFVARTDEFKALAHSLAMQVAAMAPKYVSEADIPKDVEVVPELDCLLSQPFIKDQARKIGDIVTETIAKTGENIKVKRFVRFELAE